MPGPLTSTGSLAVPFFLFSSSLPNLIPLGGDELPGGPVRPGGPGWTGGAVTVPVRTPVALLPTASVAVAVAVKEPAEGNAR